MENEQTPTVEAQSGETIEYVLKKPIMSYGQPISKLSMRYPTGGDLVRIGNPVDFYPHAEPVKVEHNWERMPKMIARLSGVPSTSIESIDPDDLIALAWTLSPFFLPKS